MEILKLFNEKVEVILNRSFIKKVEDADPLFTFELKDGHLNSQRFGPNDEVIDSVILPLRFFCQSSDRISIRQLETHYQELPISQKLKDNFNQIKLGLNKYLDEPSVLTEGTHRYTKREVFETFMYGEKAHFYNNEAKERHDRWKSKPERYPALENEFVEIVYDFIGFLEEIRKVNLEVIKQLERQKA